MRPNILALFPSGILLFLSGTAPSQDTQTGNKPAGDAQQGTPTTKPTSNPPKDEGITNFPPMPAPAPTPYPTNKGKKIPKDCWFKKIHIDFGTFVENSRENVTGEYPLENFTDDPQQIRNIIPSCKCQKLRLFIGGKEAKLERDNNLNLKAPITIPPHTKGKLVLTLDLSGSGKRIGDIRVETTDPRMPTFTLTAEALLKSPYELSPKIVELGNIVPTAKISFTVTVRNTLKKDWKILKVNEAMPPAMKVDSIERKTDSKGWVYYVIKGTYGPNIPEGSIGGTILFHTDDPKNNFQIEVRANVAEKVELFPSFWTFDRFPRSQPQEKTVYVWSTNETDKMTIDRIEIMRAILPKEFYELKIEAPKKGAKVEFKSIDGIGKKVPMHRAWKIRVRIKKGVPGRVVRLKCAVYFKEGDFVPKVFHFNGFPYN